MNPDSNKPAQQSADGETMKPSPFTNPVQFLAFGFGSGLSPKGPGTAGTLMAVPLYWLWATEIIYCQGFCHPLSLTAWGLLNIKVKCNLIPSF